MEQFDDVNFKRLAEILWRNIAFIIAFTMLFGVFSFLYSKLLIVPQYESSVTMYVKNEVETSMNKTLGSDIQTAQMLVDTYIVILRSDTFLSEVSSVLQTKGIYGFDAETLRNCMFATSVDGTEVFKVTIRCIDPLYSKIIANIVAEMSPAFIKEYIEASSAKVLDYAVEGRMVSPNVPKNMVVGLFIGLFLGYILSILKEIFDTRVKNEDELVQWFNLPILGVVPDIDEVQSRKNGYAYESNFFKYGYSEKGAGLNEN